MNGTIHLIKHVKNWKSLENNRSIVYMRDGLSQAKEQLEQLG